MNRKQKQNSQTYTSSWVTAARLLSWMVTSFFILMNAQSTPPQSSPVYSLSPISFSFFLDSVGNSGSILQLSHVVSLHCQANSELMTVLTQPPKYVGLQDAQHRAQIKINFYNPGVFMFIIEVQVVPLSQLVTTYKLSQTIQIQQSSLLKLP